MSDVIKRILGEAALSGPEEDGLVDPHVMSPEEDEEYQSRLDAESDAKFASEKRLEKLISQVFKAIGVEIRSDRRPNVDLDSREVLIELEDSQVGVATLSKLMKTGLADDYTVSSGDYCLYVEFKLAEGIETARFNHESMSFNDSRKSSR